jgi:O-methyltransferase involved in polyketide biosynthesis
MSEVNHATLSGVSETLLITLYLRAMESKRPDALIKDENAVRLVAQMDYDFNLIRQIPLSDANKLVIILRSQEFDCEVRDFLTRHMNAVVVHIGCGLDARYERVDNGYVEWFDLDFPEVIEQRRKLIGDEAGHYHLLGCSVLENTWLEALSAYHDCPFLFLAEGVFLYFEEAQVKSLVLRLREHFPGAELIFDAYSPLHVWRHNLQTVHSMISMRVHWGLWRGQEVEGWAEGIRLLDEWGFFDNPTSRLDRIRWSRPIEAIARTLRIYHFQLGNEA